VRISGGGEGVGGATGSCSLFRLAKRPPKNPPSFSLLCSFSRSFRSFSSRSRVSLASFSRSSCCCLTAASTTFSISFSPLSLPLPFFLSSDEALTLNPRRAHPLFFLPSLIELERDEEEEAGAGT